MASSIVCGIDGSAQAGAALGVAAALAERLQLRLVLVHAVTAPTPDLLLSAPSRVPVGVDQIDLTGRHVGARVLARAAETHAVPMADCRLEDAQPAAALVAVARDEDAELLVVGTRGAGVLRSAILGSVSTSVVANASCPVVVVPMNDDHPPLAGERIVCGAEGAEDFPAVLTATRLSQRLDVPLTVARVSSQGPEADVAAGVVSSRFDMRLEASSRRALHIMQRLLQNGGSEDDEPAHRVELRRGDPTSELLLLADSTRAMMLVVGSRGLGPLRGGLVGSVSRELVRRATRPVVICRRREEPA